MLVLNKKKNAPSLVSTRQALVNHGLPFEDLTPEQLKTRYPLMSYKGHYDCLLDVEAGFLIANKCHQILQVGFTFASWGGVKGQACPYIVQAELFDIHIYAPETMIF